MHSSEADGAHGYGLGDDEAEAARLEFQVSLFKELSHEFLIAAGLRPGMRVLDAGCGPGGLAFAAARIVGPTGFVRGVDLSAKHVAKARACAPIMGLGNMEFVVDDIATYDADDEFDALIGRMVLMFQQDAAAVVRNLAQRVRAGGIIAFQESITDRFETEPPLGGEFEVAVQWIHAAMKGPPFNADLRCALKLTPIFLAANLRAPTMTLRANVEHGRDAGIYELLEAIVRTIKRRRRECGIAAIGSINEDGLADRLRAGALAKNATVISPMLVGAWTRK